MATSLNIRFASDFAPPVFQLAQGTDAISLNLVCEDFFPGTGATARIYVKKPSGIEVYNSCTIDGARITVPITTQMTAEVGRAECQLNITVGGKVANSFVFYLDVSPTIIEGTAIESTSEYTALQGLINDATAAIEDAEDAANTALSAVGNYFVTASYSKSGTVHLITIPATYSTASMIRFVPTAAWSAGDTLQIKRGSASAVSVGAYTLSGEALPAGAWASGASVIFTLNGNNAYFPVPPETETEPRSTTTVNLLGTSTVVLDKVGSCVHAYFTFPGPWAEGATPMQAPIPTGYRPAQDVYSGFVRAQSGEALSTNGMQISIGASNGSITLRSTGSVANAWTYRVTLSWDVPV